MTSCLNNELYSSISALKNAISEGFKKKNEIDQNQREFEKFKTLVEANKCFKCTVTLNEAYKVELKQGEFAVNCNTCNKTCFMKKDSNTQAYSAVNSSGYCTHCGHHWSNHFNMPYVYKIREVTEDRIYEDLKKKYESALDNKTKYERILHNAKNEYKQIWDKISHYLTICKDSIDRYQRTSEGPINLDNINDIEQRKLIEAICQGREKDILPKRI